MLLNDMVTFILALLIFSEVLEEVCFSCHPNSGKIVGLWTIKNNNIKTTTTF